MKTNISQKAHNDINQIYDYVAYYFGLNVAEMALEKLEKDISILGEMPFFGKAIERTGLRMLVSKPSIIIYEVTDAVLEILHIVDARSDYANTLFN
jgi:plasmid stabilization system protein ParE